MSELRKTHLQSLIKFAGCQWSVTYNSRSRSTFFFFFTQLEIVYLLLLPRSNWNLPQYFQYIRPAPCQARCYDASPVSVQTFDHHSVCAAFERKTEIQDIKKRHERYIVSDLRVITRALTAAWSVMHMCNSQQRWKRGETSHSFVTILICSRRILLFQTFQVKYHFYFTRRQDNFLTSLWQTKPGSPRKLWSGF